MLPIFLRTDLPLLEPFKDPRPKPGHFVGLKSVPATWDADQFRVVSGSFQIFRQADALIIRNRRVGVAVDGEDGRQSSTDEVERSVGRTVEIDNGCDFNHWAEIGGSRLHADQQSQLPAGRFAHHQNDFLIHFETVGVIAEPLGGFEDIVERGGRGRGFRRPIFNVRHHEIVLDQGNAEFFDDALFAALIAVNDNHTGTILQRRRRGLDDIENSLRICSIPNVRFNLIIGAECDGSQS